MSQSFDIIIVGAGIVGAACAAECAAAGLKTLVLDRGIVGGGTTAAGMGHIVVMDDSEAQFALTEYSRRLWLQLRDQLSADVEYEVCGTLWVAADDEEMAEAHRKEKYYTDRKARVEILDGEGVRRAEPNLRPGLAGGLRVVDDGVIYPPCAARFLMDAARRHGAEYRAGAAVRALLPEGGVALADGTRLSAGRSVNATGPWSPELTPGLPVRKRKGHLVITDRYPGYVHHQIVELGYLKSAHSTSQDSVAFNIQPRQNRADVDWILAPIRCGRDGSEPCYPQPHAGARHGISAHAGKTFRHAGLDRPPRRHAGQTAPDWPEPRTQPNLAGERARRIGHYHRARARAVCWPTCCSAAKPRFPPNRMPRRDLATTPFPMADPILLRVNGNAVSVAAGTVVAAAVAQAGQTRFRRSVLGEARGPLCGMGICMECRVTINGQPHCRSCQTVCEEGMEVRTDE